MLGSAKAPQNKHHSGKKLCNWTTLGQLKDGTWHGDLPIILQGQSQVNAQEMQAPHMFTKQCQKWVQGVRVVNGFTNEVTSGFKQYYVNDLSYRISMSTNLPVWPSLTPSLLTKSFCQQVSLCWEKEGRENADTHTGWSCLFRKLTLICRVFSVSYYLYWNYNARKLFQMKIWRWNWCKYSSNAK